VKIIVFSIDSLRADSLSCYGYNRETSPNIDILAEGGTLFTNAYTQANWTHPSYYSLITGLYPSVHNIDAHHLRLAGRPPTLPESLDREGYRTVLFSNYHTLLDKKRFAGHFQQSYYFDLDMDGDKFKEVVFSHEAEDLFLLIHIGNYVHEPYYAPRELVREFWTGDFPGKKPVLRFLTEETDIADESMRDVLRKVNLRQTRLTKRELSFLKACYDAGIKHVDARLRELFAFVRERYADELILIATSDHGQGFFEHGYFGHGLNLHQELVRVPLIIQTGRSRREVSESPVQLIDVFPTLMDILGFSEPSGIDGSSFVTCLEEKEEPQRRVICEGFPMVAFIYRNKKLIISFYHLMPWTRRLRSLAALLRTGNPRKLLFHVYTLFKTAFYDLHADPGEENNLLRREKAAARTMKSFLNEWYRGCRSRSLDIIEQEIEEEQTINQLKGLGYL